MPGVGQHHQQRPHRLSAAGLLVLDEAQAAEVQFGYLPGPALLHPHRSGATSLPVAPAQPPVQGRIGDLAASIRQQLLDTGELQLVLGDPLVNLVRPGGQDLFRRDLHLPRPRLAYSGQTAQLLLLRAGSAREKTHLLGRSHILAHCDPRYARA